jgi:hypothetical protein
MILAIGVEVEDIDTVPAHAGAESQPDRQLEQWGHPAAVNSGEVVAADPAQRGFAGGLVDQLIFWIKAHGANRAAELRRQRSANCHSTAMAGAVSWPVLCVLGKRRDHGVEIVAIENIGEGAN